MNPLNPMVPIRMMARTLGNMKEGVQAEFLAELLEILLVDTLSHADPGAVKTVCDLFNEAAVESECDSCARSMRKMASAMTAIAECNRSKCASYVETEGEVELGDRPN